MSGITDLETLLASLNPVLALGEFVFVSRQHCVYGDGIELSSIASFVEHEGLTLVVQKEQAVADWLERRRLDAVIEEVPMIASNTK